VRPAGEAYPCLACESHARLKAAGFTPGSPEIKQIAEWNRVAFHHAARQPETPQTPPEAGAEAEQNAEPQITADTAPAPAKTKEPEREKEACG
jgi:hypothetical protein